MTPDQIKEIYMGIYIIIGVLWVVFSYRGN